MAKPTSGRQLEMLLMIAGKKSESDSSVSSVKKNVRTLSYDKIVDSLRKKGLTKTVAKP